MAPSPAVAGSTPQSCSRPTTLPTRSCTRVGHERAGERRLELALGAVVEHRPCRLDRRRGVGEVVGQHLLGVGTAVGRQGADPIGHHGSGQVEGSGGGGEVGRGAHRRGRLPTGHQATHIGVERGVAHSAGGSHQGVRVLRVEPRAVTGLRRDGRRAGRDPGPARARGGVRRWRCRADGRGGRCRHRGGWRGDRRDPRGAPGQGDRPCRCDRAARHALDARAQGAHGRAVRCLRRAARRPRYVRGAVRDADLGPARRAQQAGGDPRRGGLLRAALRPVRPGRRRAVPPPPTPRAGQPGRRASPRCWSSSSSPAAPVLAKWIGRDET